MLADARRLHRANRYQVDYSAQPIVTPWTEEAHTPLPPGFVNAREGEPDWPVGQAIELATGRLYQVSYTARNFFQLRMHPADFIPDENNNR